MGKMGKKQISWMTLDCKPSELPNENIAPGKLCTASIRTKLALLLIFE